MKTRFFPLLMCLGLMNGVSAARAAEKILSDIATGDKRRAVLETATQLAKPHAPAPLTGQLPNPFDPSGFGQADAEERAAELAAARAAQKSTATRAPNDRDLLERLASKLVATGTMIGRDGQRILYFGKNPVKIGTPFTITDSGVDYRFELTAIDSTTFTLRYNREEIIRPIKPGK